MTITITINNPLDATAAEIAAELDRLSAELKAAINADAASQPAPIVQALGVMDSARAVIARQGVTQEQRAALEAYARAYAERLAAQESPAQFEQLVTYTRNLHRRAQEAVDAAKGSVNRLSTREIDTGRKCADLETPNAAIMAIRETVQAAYEKATASA